MEGEGGGAALVAGQYQGGCCYLTVLLPSIVHTIFASTVTVASTARFGIQFLGRVDFPIQTYPMGSVHQPQRNGRINPILLGGTAAGIRALEFFIPCQYRGGDVWT